MNSYEFLEKLKNSRKAVFGLSDLSKVLNKNEGYTKIFVNRLVKKKLIIRIERNKYSILNTNPFSLSSNIIFPSYISFFSAYSFYGLTTQIPSKFYVVSLKQKAPINFNGGSITFVKFKKENFFGYKRDVLENKFVFIAEVEKAILDSLYLPFYCPVSETFFAINNAKLNEKKLFQYAKKMNSNSVLKKLGYLLDLIGKDYNIKIENESYVSLNPLNPPKGRKNKKWRVIVNEVLE